jgi:predicted DsbA family dithiol-disulfide isomerase
MKKGFIIFSLLTTLFLFLFLFSASAKVYITSYCDVSLESCRAQDQALDLLVEKYPHDLEVEYLYYFDISDAKSSMAQIALECANRQGYKNDFKAELQNNLEDLSRDALKGYAANVGLTAANFSFCLDTQMTAWDVLDEVIAAEDDGVTFAPTVRFNMDLYSGSQTFTSLHELLKDYLGLDGAPVDAETTETSVSYGEQEETEQQTDADAVQEEADTSVSSSEARDDSALQEIGDPLFFRVIRQLRTWFLDVFSS